MQAFKSAAKRWNHKKIDKKDYDSSWIKVLKNKDKKVHKNVSQGCHK